MDAYTAASTVRERHRNEDYVQATVMVTVNNVRPTLTAAEPQTVNEGSPLVSITNIGTITDPGFQNSVAGDRRAVPLLDQLG